MRQGTTPTRSAKWNSIVIVRAAPPNTVDPWNVSAVTLCGRFSQGNYLSVAALCRMQSVNSDWPHFCFIFAGPVLGWRVYFSTHNPLLAGGFIYSLCGRIFRRTLIGRTAFAILKFWLRAFLVPHIRARSVPFFPVLSSPVPSLDFQA